MIFFTYLDAHYLSFFILFYFFAISVQVFWFDF